MGSNTMDCYIHTFFSKCNAFKHIRVCSPVVLYINSYFIYMTTETIDYDQFIKKTSFVSFLWVYYGLVGMCEVN